MAEKIKTLNKNQFNFENLLNLLEDGTSIFTLFKDIEELSLQKNPTIIPLEDKLSKLISVVGHVDHGKSTCSSVLSYIARIICSYGRGKILNYNDLDKTKEEMERGITISTKVNLYETHLSALILNDCPGHADYVNNMLHGAAFSTTAILLVAANAGPAAQTKEHLRLVSQNPHLTQVIVLINKIDLIDDPSEIELIQDMVMETVQNTMGPNWQKYGTTICLPVSGLKAQTVINKYQSALKSCKNVSDFIKLSATDENFQYLDNFAKVLFLLEPSEEEAENIKEKNNQPFMLWVENVANIKGIGSVLSGAITQGTVVLDQTAQLVDYGAKNTIDETESTTFDKKDFKFLESFMTDLPSEYHNQFPRIVVKTGRPIIHDVKLVGLQAFHHNLKKAYTYWNVGLAVKSNTLKNKSDIYRGQVLCKSLEDLGMKHRNAIIVESFLIPASEGGRSNTIKSGYKVQCHIATCDVTGEIFLPKDCENMKPGETKNILLILGKGILLKEGSKLIMREGGKTVMSGVVKFVSNKDHK